MGSGNNNRKKKDAPFIRRPKSIFSTGAGTPDAGEIAADICIPSFDKGVNKSNLTQPGVEVRLQKKGEIYYIMIGANEVGSLNENHSKMISECAKLGVRYSGEIVIKNDKPYARFDRVSR